MDEDFGWEKTPHGAHGEEAAVGHVPVLLQEATDFLAIRRGGTYIDATLGLGGHSFEIARRLGPQGHLIGFDKDPQALDTARKRLMEEQGETPAIALRHGSYAEIGQDVRAASANGI